MPVHKKSWSLVLLAAVLLFGVASGNGKSKIQFPRPLRTVVVDAGGGGDFSTVQSAVDAVPENNSGWFCIYVKAGLYREKVKIPVKKEYIYLKGEGKRRTNVVYDDHSSIDQSPTLMAEADNFFAKSISFANTYNLPAHKNGNPRTVAVAAMIGGDRSSFYQVGFYGLQDTLWDLKGRHFFKRCTIVGAVDFIFGHGQSIYERCTVGVTAASLGPGAVGFITAQGRAGPAETNGFVFKDCVIKGDGLTYLGRAWRSYSRVVFYNTSMSPIVVPQGWDPWNNAGKEGLLTFVEDSCKGPGSDKTGRVEWMKKMDQAELSQLISMDFIFDSEDDNWLKYQPYSRILD